MPTPDQPKARRRSRLAGQALLLIVEAIGISGCNGAEEPTPAPAATSSLLSDATPSSDDDAQVTPAELFQPGMTAADRALVKAWWVQEVTCHASDSSDSDGACSREDVVAAKLKRRGWCWGYEDWTVVRADYRWHLCSETTLPLNQRSVPPETVEGADGAQNPPYSNSREQRREDARAAIRESWLVKGATIQRINFAFSCGWVDRITAGLAIQNVEGSMQDELFPAGLGDDTTMQVQPVAKRFMESGRDEARSGKCAEFTPAMRGGLRNSVAMLARM